MNKDKPNPDLADFDAKKQEGKERAERIATYAPYNRALPQLYAGLARVGMELLRLDATGDGYLDCERPDHPMNAAAALSLGPMHLMTAAEAVRDIAEQLSRDEDAEDNLTGYVHAASKAFLQAASAALFGLTELTAAITGTESFRERLKKVVGDDTREKALVDEYIGLLAQAICPTEHTMTVEQATILAKTAMCLDDRTALGDALGSAFIRATEKAEARRAQKDSDE